MEKQTSKKCPSCGKAISEASVFCPFCRAKMEVSPSVSLYGDATLEGSSVEHVVEEKPALFECEKREAAERQATPRKGRTIPLVVGMQSEGLTNDSGIAPVVVAASDSPVGQKLTSAEASSDDMAAIIMQLINTEYSDFSHVSISDAESTARMLVHEVYGVYEKQSSVYRYLTREQPQRVGGYELNSRGEQSDRVLEEEIPQVIQVTRNYLLLRATMENNTQEGLRAIERGADPNVACIYNGTRSFPIIEAALKGNARLVNTLIEAGADVNVRKDNSELALLDAACYEHIEAAEALLANGADPNAISRGLTPLTQAESVEMIQLLLRYGADPNIPDGDGDLPIVTRITNRDKRGTIALRDAGSDASHRNKRGQSADDFCQRYFRCRLEDLQLQTAWKEWI